MKKAVIIIVILALYALFVLGFTFAHNNGAISSTLDKLGLKSEAVSESGLELGDLGDPGPPPPPGGGP